MPTLVLYGRHNPLVTADGGRATAIPSAKLITFPGMGHDLPRPLWPAITAAIRGCRPPQAHSEPGFGKTRVRGRRANRR
ncbi:pimeloyl-ACP methyl ester carboxylesterase [Streptosporangium album]|uniref:Pimeloyl-ACP methyl ester carboxylesterase n=1 Tax=Streptosporangium album TaxID=47479 RepID=A0A7W7S3M9_9ACTN|nr:hypothetical protein [Streptosporangium album]MBB4943329.1 pimeloyl-ACP methyl ester carboxylesterase [Streptosporangium album]